MKNAAEIEPPTEAEEVSDSLYCCDCCDRRVNEVVPVGVDELRYCDQCVRDYTDTCDVCGRYDIEDGCGCGETTNEPNDTA